MTWEIIVGLTTLLTAFLSVMSVIVKVNRTLVSLEEAVKRLTASFEKQQRKNGNFQDRLLDHERRLLTLEERKKIENETKGEMNHEI